ncbi:MAG: hypothetical protein QXW06_08390 [Thermoplasmata archaeon]
MTILSSTSTATGGRWKVGTVIPAPQGAIYRFRTSQSGSYRLGLWSRVIGQIVFPREWGLPELRRALSVSPGEGDCESWARDFLPIESKALCSGCGREVAPELERCPH